MKNYEQNSFYQVILQYCKHRTLAPSRVKVYKVLARQLRPFELFVQHTTSPLFSLNYETMSMQDLENFRDYVRNEYKYKEKYPAIFRSILEEAPKIEGEKYKNATICKRSENYLSCRLFPFLSSQKYNERLKEIFRKCGITRIVQVLNPTTGDYEMKPICDVASSHMARRTFIGVSYKLTHDPNIICKMTDILKVAGPSTATAASTTMT